MEVDGPSVERAWRTGPGWFHLLLRTDDRASIAAFEAVLHEVNAAHEDDGPEAQLGAGTPGGHVVLVDSVPDAAALARWIDDVATGLRRRGATGTLAGARSAHPPAWVRRTMEPLPTAFTAWTVDYSSVRANPADLGWQAAPATTRAVTAAVARWVAEGGPAGLLRRDTFGVPVATEPEGMAALVVAGLEAGDFVGLVCTGEDRSGRLADFAGAALTIAQVVGIDDWRARLDALRKVITAHPDLVDHAAVRPASVAIGSWDGLDVRQRLPGQLGEHDIRYNQHLLPHRAYDAHGLQVLREEHLALAHDLSGWLVSELGHGRYLVEAGDLAPWYASDLPDPAVVEQARADFGRMLLTPEVVRSHRPPFPRPGVYDR